MSPSRARRAYGMAEDELAMLVRGWAEDHGYLLHHVPDSRASWGRGYPDLTIAGHGRLIFAELKPQRRASELRPAQRDWLAALRAAGAETHVWAPLDWVDESIQKALPGALA